MNLRILGLLVLSSSLLLNACLDGSSSKSKKTDDMISQSIEIPFVATAGSAVLKCGVAMDSLGITNETGNIEDFRFYVHDIKLISENGDSFPLTLDNNDWQTANVTLLSFKNKENCAVNSGENLPTNSLAKGTYEAPADTVITGISFGVGVPFALNHQNPSSADSPLNISSMHWDWQGGYIHMRIEAEINGKDLIFHLGSRNCDGDPNSGGTTACSRNNRPLIELSNFDIANSAIKIDFKALIEDIDVSDIGDTMADKCHSSPMQSTICQPAFDRLGLDFYNMADETLPQAHEGQSVFSSILNPA